MEEGGYISHSDISICDIQVYNVTPYNDTQYTDESLLSSSSTYDSSFATVMKLEKYTLPIICVLGLIGNTLSTITFLRRPLRNAPCSLYLATRGLSDNGFLLSLFLIWISSTFNLKLSQIRGVCQVIIFMTYVCGCVSVWLCVFITFENFLLIRSPFLARRVCCNQFSKICISVLVLAAAGVYHISLWISREDCSHDASYAAWTQVLVFSDTLLTLVLPTVIIFVLLSVIACKMIKIIHIHNLHNTVIAKISHSDTRTIKPILPIAKVTKMLFVVSFTFFALNVPSHVIRLMLLTGAFRNGYKTAPLVQATIQASFQLIYYLSFSINVCVYALFGSNFRTIFKKTFCKGSTRSRATYVHTEAVNLVHQRRHSMNGYVEEKKNATCLVVPANDRECHSFT